MPSGGGFSIKWMFFFIALMFKHYREKMCQIPDMCTAILTQDSWFRFLFCCRRSCEKTVSFYILLQTTNEKYLSFRTHVEEAKKKKKNPVQRGILTRLRLWLCHYGVKSGNPGQGCLPETICQLIHKIDNSEQGPQTLDPWKTKHKKEGNVVCWVSFLPHWNELMFVESLSMLWPTMSFAIC